MELLSFLATGIRVTGWALIHFVWQAGLIGLLYAAVKVTLPRGEPRYRLGMLALLALACCPLITGWHLLQTAAPVVLSARDSVAVAVTVPGTAISAMDDSAARWMPDGAIDALLPWLVLGWLVGVSGLSLRAWRQWRNFRLLMNAAATIESWQVRVDAMTGRFGLARRVRVLCSDKVSTPLLFGWIRPVILLPLAVACHFPVAQVELILAHELAHIRRWDPLANLFQVVLETLHFYHPVVHWISRDVRNEREVCCDRLALSASGGSGHVLASALAELGELREPHAPMTLAANGGVLLDRVQQLMLPPAGPAVVASPARFTGVLLAAAVMLVLLRMEWSEAYLQRNLTATLSQWNAALLAPPLVPRLAALPVIRNLVPLRLDAMHPDASSVLEAAAVRTDIVALPPVLLRASARISAPMAVPLRIVDLPFAHSESPERITSPTATAVPPSALEPMHVRRPTYPQDALLQGLEGTVMMEFVVGQDGSVHDLKVVSASLPGVFEQAALQAMHGWKFAGDNTRAPRRYRQTMAFTLSGSRMANPASSGTGSQEVVARVGCQVSTGSNICRLPENAPGSANQ